ncbi:MAG TPA: hypothetical protein VIG49_05550 [Acetobacteraceae bacterium]|jgi:hypothetical protein
MATCAGLRLVIYTGGGLLLSLARLASMPADITTLAFDPAHLSDAAGQVVVVAATQRFEFGPTRQADPLVR